MKTFLFLTMAFCHSVMAGNGKNNGLPNGKPFQNLQEQIDVITMDIEDLQDMMNERVDDLQDQLDALDVQVKANSGNITLIQEQQELQDELIATLVASVAELVERVEQNQEDVQDALDLLESTVDSAVTAIDSRLNALEGDIEDLGDDVDTNANNVAANAAAIVQADSLLQQKADMLESAIEAAISTGTANSASISDLENALTAAQDELATKQHRVTQVCSPGYSIRAIAEDGAVTCEADDSAAALTSYTSARYDTRTQSSIYVVTYCASGYTMSGGGHYKSSSAMNLYYSRPRGNGWEVFSFSPNTGRVHAYARCMKTI